MIHFRLHHWSIPKMCSGAPSDNSHPRHFLIVYLTPILTPLVRRLGGPLLAPDYRVPDSRFTFDVDPSFIVDFSFPRFPRTPTLPITNSF